MKNAKTNNIIIILLVFALAFSAVFFNAGACVAHAEDAVQYSDVLYDLHKDSKFDESNYPENFKDYSISLIQIAEGVDGDIFVYVYQPSGSVKDYRASSINVSTSINNALAPFNYKLEYINSSGVFYKYKIKDLKVSDNNIRYYTIPSIYRPFDEQVDVKAGGDNTINEVAFAVSRQYAFGTVKGEPYVECVDIQTIEVTDKFVGFVRSPSGFNFGTTEMSYADGHFVAFTTDKPMDKLLEATVEYVTKDVELVAKGNISISVIPLSYEIGDPQKQHLDLAYTDTYEGEAHGLFYNYSYSWDRIQNIDDFLNSIESDQTIYSGEFVDVSYSTEITEDAMNALKTKKWVLRFAETSYSQSRYINMLNPSTKYYKWESTDVSEVTILRLKFETDGDVYNLGVVDNKQTGSSDPINPDWDKPFGGDVTVTLTPQAKKTMSIVLIVIICICAVMLLIPILKAIYSLNHSKQSFARSSSSSTRKSNKKPNKKTSKKR